MSGYVAFSLVPEVSLAGYPCVSECGTCRVCREHRTALNRYRRALTTSIARADRNIKRLERMYPPKTASHR